MGRCVFVCREVVGRVGYDYCNIQPTGNKPKHNHRQPLVRFVYKSCKSSAAAAVNYRVRNHPLRSLSATHPPPSHPRAKIHRSIAAVARFPVEHHFGGCRCSRPFEKLIINGTSAAACSTARRLPSAKS